MKLTRKQLAVLFLPVIFLFSLYFLRADLVGADSYFFLDYLCHNGSIETQPILAQIAFSLLPCDFLALKAVLLASCIASVVSLAFLTSLFVKERAWMAGLLVFSMPIFFFEFLKLENEIFAYPLLFASAFFYYRNKKFDRWVAVALVITAGLFWGGAAYVAVAYALTSWQFILLAAPILWFYTSPFVAGILPDLGVSESIFGKTFVSLFIGLLGFMKPIMKLLPQLIFFLLIGMINAKFLILVVPFLLPCLVSVVESLEWKYRKWIYLLVVTLVISQGISVFRVIPTQDQLGAVKLAIELGDGQVQNDWDYGHWIVFYGGDTNARFHWTWQRDWHAGVVLTREWLPECEVRGEFGDVNVYWCEAFRYSFEASGGGEEGVLTAARR